MALPKYINVFVSADRFYNYLFDTRFTIAKNRIKLFLRIGDDLDKSLDKFRLIKLTSKKGNKLVTTFVVDIMKRGNYKTHPLYQKTETCISIYF